MYIIAKSNYDHWITFKIIANNIELIYFHNIHLFVMKNNLHNNMYYEIINRYFKLVVQKYQTILGNIHNIVLLCIIYIISQFLTLNIDIVNKLIILQLDTV